MMKSQRDYIEIFGARVHNLKNINLKIPRNKLVVFTGKSGSGKSSLAFDTIHSEGQRRYLETFNAYARQFIGNLESLETTSFCVINCLTNSLFSASRPRLFLKVDFLKHFQHL